MQEEGENVEEIKKERMKQQLECMQFLLRDEDRGLLLTEDTVC